ncbi:S8 family serine peptidase [Thermosipho ferrireducens]|uniref:S8 family serine peptidase n=1 Tax=Thermosipho ferrireducens TaxID=2571116 RepID=A0ABX7S7F5_9BACT|nr:S8 family serine peptidase [Thermosipho ferrireducens]QTA37201.1 S8 family serine peptidase [Thermosipho ferrireducens]
MKIIFRYVVPLTILLLLVLSACGLNNSLNDSLSMKNNEGIIKYPSVENVDMKYQEGKVLVGYENRESVQKIIEVLNGEISVDLPQIKMVSIKFDGTVEEAFKKLSKIDLSGIKYVEPSYVRQIIDPKPVSDSVIYRDLDGIKTFATTGGSDEEFSKYLWGLDAINARTAWETATGSGVVVAVIDTGVDGMHPDLVGQVIKGYRPLTDEILEAGTDSSYGGAHGTHVAGTIAASSNGIGIVGVAPDAKIMPIVIFDTSGYVGDDEVAEGIIWAVDNGADILQNSWGGWGYSYTLKSAFDYALDKNVVVTVSAGNSHTDQHLLYPAGYPGIIQVGAVEYYGGNFRTVWFSSRSDGVIIGAPGVEILSTVPRSNALGYEGYSLGKDAEPYDFYQGTSMACPHVSGVVALLLEKYPNAKPWQIKKLLEKGAVDIDELGYDHSSGYGLVNAANSLSYSLDTTGGVTFDVKAEDSLGYPLSAVFVTMKRLDGNGSDYFAKTDSNGIAHFSNIDAGKYELIVGGPDSNDRAYAGGYFGNSMVYRMEEERQYNRIINLTADSTETFAFSSTFVVKFGEPSTTLSNATVTIDSAIPEILSGKRFTITAQTFDTNTTYDFSSIADYVVIRVERDATGATVTLNGTATINGYDISISGVLGKDATVTIVDDQGGTKGVSLWWSLFGQS